MPLRSNKVEPRSAADYRSPLCSLRRDGRFVTVGFASGDTPRLPLNLVLVKGSHVHGSQSKM